MIKDIKELNFPAYATLETATAAISDMGDRTITSQVKIDGDVVPDFSYDWEVEFKGERHIHPVKTPQGTKDNSSLRAKIDLVFQHWAIYEMKRQYFVEMASTSAGTAIADKYIASLGLNLEDFIVVFNLVLNHYFGGRIIINLNPNPLQPYSKEAKFVSISYSYIWDVLQQMHEIYGVRWTLKTNADGVCEILMGYPAEEVSHIFEYGFEGGLLSVQRQVQSTDIRNRLLGRGGSKNLPARYFKDKDPNNPLFEADPDWIPELANITFTELRGKTFRDYVRGWKAKRYGGTPMAEPTEAYLAGYNAEKFDPIEYVDDKESIEKYGVLVGALKNNEGIYPSIQGAPGDVDMIVDAEQVTDDDVDAAVENDSVTTNLESGHQTYRNAPANSTITIETLTKRYFSVPAGKVGNLDMSLTVTGKYSNVGDYEPTYPILKTETVNITVYDSNTDEIVKSSVAPVVNLPAGDYYYMITADVETNYDKASMVTLNIESVYLYVATPNKEEGWKSTFDIWVRNIWGSERNAGETDQQYADRVWAPILGDRTGGEARVVFASGWLSFSSDWEFPIVGYAYDDSKEGGHWRLTLAKSEAELEASGKYIPYEGYNASAGDRFFFIGIDMPHQYVLWAEERVDDYKRDRLPETARINPSWVIKTDKVRLNQDRNGAFLVDSINIGAQIRLASKQLISGSYESLYVQSMTYNWTADTILYPDVEVVVSDKVATVKNPVAQMQGNIETLQRQVGSLSNIQQIIRQVCDQLYLRKDGVEDLSKSPTRFLGKVTGEKFRQGQIGGKDWGIYRDENGNAILEADKLVARQGILVSDLVVNEATYVGGLQIRSAAHMDVTSVEDTEAGYVCSFDQKQGSVTNKFTEDDVVLCQKFDADQSEVKFYKRRVVSVSETSVTLSKMDVNGTGVPAEGDVIIHYGNYTDKSRQFVIISDVIGGGYERMLMGLDSVASDGVEYYFAGKSADSKARWFVGGAEQYAEYKDGQLTIKGNIFVTGSDQSINEQIAQLDFIRNAFGENAQGLILGTAIVVGYNDDEGKFVPMAGLSGVYDKEADNGGPAAWYGGTPEDAKSVIFMDGTGYFADGLFKWDKDKGVNLGNGAIWINYDGSVDFGDQIRIGASGDETLGSLLTIVATLADIWKIDEETGDLVTDRNVRIAKNVIIGGDTSTGGTGEDPSVSGTVTGIRVDANTILEPTNGIVDMSDVLANLEVDVDLSDYYTKQETTSEIASAIAEINIPSLDGYATEAYVTDAITALNLGQYATTASLATLQTEVDNIEAILGMDEEAEGVINTWNEVKAFLDGYSSSDDLAAILSAMNADIAKRALDSDLETLALTVGDNTTNIRNLKDSVYTKDELATYKAWWDDLMSLVVKEGSDIKIKTNLIVAGDTSSEGTGESVVSGITGIKLNGTTYKDDNNDGIIDLGTITGGLTSVSWSDVQGRPTKVSEFLNDSGFITSAALLGYATQSWVEGKGYITGIDRSMVASAVGSSGNAGKVLSSTGGDLGWVSLPTSLPASDVYAWAKKSSLAASDVPNLSWNKITSDKPTTLSGYGITDNVAYRETWNNFTHTGNEFTFASPAYSGFLWMNYRTASGNTDGAITEYRFAKGAGFSYADIRAAKYIVNGGTSSQFLKADGSLDSTAYLPLSGGTIASSGVSPLGLKTTRSSSPASYITIYGTSGNVFGYMGYSYSSGMFLQHSEGNYIAVTSTDAVFNGNSLIHSGNIGDYTIRYHGNKGAIDFNNELNNGLQYVSGSSSNGGMAYDIMLSTCISDSAWQLVGGRSGELRYRGGLGTASGWGSWKTIAFTDSNVASAQALAHSSGIVGAVVENSGNIVFKYGSAVYQSGGANVAYYGTAQSELGSSYDGALMYAYHNRPLYFYTDGIRMLINSSGNVLIGTTTDLGYKLDVNGTANFSGSVSVGNANSSSLRLLRSGYHSYIIGSSSLALSTNGNNNNIALALWEDKSASFAGAVTMSSTLNVSGLTTINGNLIVAGDISA